MLRLILALGLLLPAVLPAQTLERSLGLELTPHYGSHRLSNARSVILDRLERLDSLEQGRAGFAIGAVYESRVDRIGFTTGLRYTYVGYETLEQAAPGGGTYTDRVSAHYLSLPFEVNFYQDVTEKDRVLFVLGIAGQYHLGTGGQRTSLTGGAETGSSALDLERSDYRPFLASFVTGIGYDRKLSANWALRVQPNFQFFLNGSLRPDTAADVNRNYYQVGLRVVVRRLFI
ncbi:outer membrane beta-barrel protein [Lewinella sp. IMCC34183]|uniref:outer membrane beta-barrel protein n=1 Tax=Lewinella sp. IMCC34183 TaxID=2248762 RepID=UPI000E232852|nr:outer membrane beta-barrel protein [Lewinella sp. IMCC34183]